MFISLKSQVKPHIQRSITQYAALMALQIKNHNGFYFGY